MIHQNSLLAHKQLKKNGAHNRILQALHITGRPMTDREIKDFLRAGDMNAVRPRITELVGMNRVKECGTVKDHETRRKVRLVRLLSPDENQQPELF